jgi:hypothetical protein
MAAAAIALVGVALAASYSVISLPSPGEWQATGIGVGKVAAVIVENAYPTNSTFILSRISADGSVTNALLTCTDVDGQISADIGTGTNIYIFAGDRLLRSGTITNASPVKIILTN